eukprot:COSAG04_NODE_6839_length_1244_cov_1.762445_2_plen_184_part_00
MRGGARTEPLALGRASPAALTATKPAAKNRGHRRGAKAVACCHNRFRYILHTTLDLPQSLMMIASAAISRSNSNRSRPATVFATLTTPPLARLTLVGALGISKPSVTVKLGIGRPSQLTQGRTVPSLLAVTTPTSTSLSEPTYPRNDAHKLQIEQSILSRQGTGLGGQLGVLRPSRRPRSAAQ